MSIPKISDSRTVSAHLVDGVPLVIWGLLACGFFAAHSATHVARGTPEHALWVCHVSNLLIGVGLLSRSPALNAIGLLVLLVGVPLWLANLASGGEFLATSLLTHLGGLAVATVGAQRLGVPGHVWFRALLVVVALIAASLWWTPPGANVNLAFGGAPILATFSVHPKLHLTGLIFFWGIGLWLAERFAAQWLPEQGSKST